MKNEFLIHLVTYLVIGSMVTGFVVAYLTKLHFYKKHGNDSFNSVIEVKLEEPRTRAALYSTLLDPTTRKMFRYWLYATSFGAANAGADVTVANPVHLLPYRAASEHWSAPRIEAAVTAYSKWIDDAIASFAELHQENPGVIRESISRVIDLKEIEGTEEVPYLLWDYDKFESEVELQDQMRVW